METLKRWAGILTDPDAKLTYTQYVEQWEQKIGSLLQFDLDRDTSTAIEDGVLNGVPFAVKDNIAVKNFGLTCGSKILENVTAPYTATAVTRLQAAGAKVVAKTNMDEFGMGSSTDNSALKQTNNPWHPDAVSGGSSGGSAAAVAAGLVPFALGSDTGGSVRQPAAFCGCYGLKPTYGSVSRYGLVAYASSLEVIGILANDIQTTKAVYDVIAAQDEMDQSSLARPENQEVPDVKKIGVLKQLSDLNSPVKAAYQETIDLLKKQGYQIVEVDIPALDYVVPAYYTIATAEASSNLARYTGIRYGLRAEGADSPEEMVKATRNAGFGDEVKLRILLGTYVLRSGFQDQYYIRAQKIRTAIRDGFERIFKDVELLLTPVFPSQAFKRGTEGLSPFQQKLADKFTASANLAGIPALAFPTGVTQGLPVGMQFMAPAFGERQMFDTVAKLAAELPAIQPPGFRDWGQR